MSEHSSHAVWITHLVTVWIINDGDYYEEARRRAAQGADRLESFLSHVLRDAPKGSAPWHTAQGLAPDDYSRIHWDDIVGDLLSETEDE